MKIGYALPDFCSFTDCVVHLLSSEGVRKLGDASTISYTISMTNCAMYGECKVKSVNEMIYSKMYTP